MKNWIEVIPALKEILKRHFPDASPDAISEWANEIQTGRSVAASLEQMERGNTDPGHDIEILRSAARNIELAGNKLEKVGWHGNKSISEYAVAVRSMKENLPGQPLMATMDAGTYLALFLRDFSTRMSEAADNVDPEGASVMSAFGDNESFKKGSGRNRKTAAYLTADEAYNAFAALTGKAPSVTTNTLDNTAAGPFLAFVADVFICMGIEASPETWARAVCREKTRRVR